VSVAAPELPATARLERGTGWLPFEDALAGVRLLRELPGFLRRPLSLEEARASLRRRFERRAEDFLAFARVAIYANPASPYRWLLAQAGCGAGDLRALVTREGLEGALGSLWRQGVYMTVDELKGRRPLIRGSATLELHPAQLCNPRAVRHLPAQTGGSRSTSGVVPIDLENVRDRAVNRRIQMEARGGVGWAHAMWGVPGGQTMINLLEFAALGAPPARWFAAVDPSAPGLHPRYRWSARLLRWGSVLVGVPLPALEYVSPEDVLRIAGWMAGVLRAGRTPHVFAYASGAVRLCVAAREAGLDLRGARFSVGAEPVTETRLAVIRDVGAEVVCGYSTIEAGRIGYGCLAAAEPDELHLLHDLVALVQTGAEGPPRGLPPRGLLVTSLRPTAPVVLLNVSLGDQAELDARICGCAMEAAGWTTHLHTIRSFEKLTLGGMAFLDTDVVRVLERVLPTRFGGGPTDYQLVEEEDPGGGPVLRLLVHPRIGPVDPAAVADGFLQGIGGGSGAERVMELQWRQSGLLRVERRAPLATSAGKILHLHLGRGASARSSPSGQGTG
jgi:hypothetical protein